MLGASLAAGLGARQRVAAADQRADEPRRHLVTIVLSGGVDCVLTIDPKDPSTGSQVECGYKASERLRGKRRFYGPLMGDLMRHEESLCLIHGVRSDTVAHMNGLAMIYRGTIDLSPSTPWIGDVIGAALPGSAPIEHLLLRGDGAGDMLLGSGYDPIGVVLRAKVTRDLLDPKVPTTWARPSASLDQAWADEARPVFGKAAATGAGYLDSVHRAESVRALLGGADHKTDFKEETLASHLQMAVSALRRNLARCITVFAMGARFDSHTDCMNVQRQRVVPAYGDIARFIDLLRETRDEHGSLLDRTTIAIGSEFGRFPRFNAVNGKDHWPESTWMLLGGGVRREAGGLTLGETLADFRGAAIDYRTGKTSGPDARPIFLNNIFATLVRAAGISQARSPYAAGDVLECALDRST
jgi:hypothetical protein